jgi:phosphate acetyltransferase
MNELRKHDKYEALIYSCHALAPVQTAVAHPCDESSLAAAVDAAAAKIIKPILVGPEARIRALAGSLNLDNAGLQIVHQPHSHAAAEKAMQLVRSGEADALMKGSLHTDELKAEVVRKDTGIRTTRRISHVFVMDVPTYPKPLFVTDAAVNIFPTLEDKVHIVQNAIDLAHVLQIATPKVAILSAVETITSKIPSTIEAAALPTPAYHRSVEPAVRAPSNLDQARARVADAELCRRIRAAGRRSAVARNACGVLGYSRFSRGEPGKSAADITARWCGLVASHRITEMARL